MEVEDNFWLAISREDAKRISGIHPREKVYLVLGMTSRAEEFCAILPDNEIQAMRRRDVTTQGVTGVRSPIDDIVRSTAVAAYMRTNKTCNEQYTDEYEEIVNAARMVDSKLSRMRACDVPTNSEVTDATRRVLAMLAYMRDGLGRAEEVKKLCAAESLVDMKRFG